MVIGTVMRIGVYEHKAAKGLIRVLVKIVDDTIEELSITGDFFMYPEDALFELEQSLKGLKASWNDIENKLNEFFGGGIILAGSTPDDFKTAIRGALREAGFP
ncbi:lipoate protein ligase C-terminal domain-containing protein [Thermogladius sp. 4427co]|uniref:lipoate protein ligase C-terminal domain-containing protein n=1 Tax=Thermogladius sp. 4427co TaxID=3450718 RepID=UPI003F798E3F